MKRYVAFILSLWLLAILSGFAFAGQTQCPVCWGLESKAVLPVMAQEHAQYATADELISRGMELAEDITQSVQHAMVEMSATNVTATEQ
ncbi:MAG: hypothetical protein IJU48_04555 [Synergistaceae bacterium]|nr:hypothetical protein [Synergistaceae bacterium]